MITVEFELNPETGIYEECKWFEAPRLAAFAYQPWDEAIQNMNRNIELACLIPNKEVK